MSEPICQLAAIMPARLAFGRACPAEQPRQNDSVGLAFGRARPPNPALAGVGRFTELLR